MVRLLLTISFCMLAVFTYSQATIYVAPSPKTYWQQKREDADKALLYQMMLTESAEKNLRQAEATASSDAQKCINNVRSYYTSLSDYPSIGAGIHDVHVYDGEYLCQKTKASVSLNGKINWIGNGKFFDAKSSDTVKNAKTKAIFEIEGKTFFLDIFFIYEK